MVHIQETSTVLEIAGRVADFCPFCRSIQPFTLRRLNRLEMGLVALGPIPLLIQHQETVDGNHDRVCEGCDATLVADARSYEAVVPKGIESNVDDLVQKTNPGVHARHAQRLALEARVLRNEVEPRERYDIIREPFDLLEPQVQEVAKPRRRRRELWILLGLWATAGLGALVAWRFPAAEPVAAGVGALGLVGGFLMFPYLAVVWFYRSIDMSRVMRQTVYPLLARSLKPLKPTLEELVDIRAALRKRGLEVAKVVDVRRLLDELSTTAAPAPSAPRPRTCRRP